MRLDGQMCNLSDDVEGKNVAQLFHFREAIRLKRLHLMVRTITRIYNVMTEDCVIAYPIRQMVSL